MKKDEMIDIIEYILLDYSIDFEGTNSNSYWELASTILTKIEDKGMLPPFSHKIHEQTWRDGRDGHEWESE